MNTGQQNNNLYLIDGSGFIFRAYHGLPPLTRPDGTPVGAVYGFCTMLIKLLEDHNVKFLNVVFDTARKNFRHDIYGDYKANRDEPPEDLIPQFGLIREACKAFNIPMIEQNGYEADDIIATYAKMAQAKGINVTIVSSDKDLMQLVGDGVEMFDPLKNKSIKEKQVHEKFGVGPNRVVDVQSLAGDSSDNVPGVPGIGIKTAALLINEYGSLETLLERAEEIKQPKRRQNLIEFADDARISKQLVQLCETVPVDENLDAFTRKIPVAQDLYDFLNEQGFKTFIDRVQKKGWIEGAQPAKAQAAAPVIEESNIKTEYTLVQDIETLEKWVYEARHYGYVAVDTETNSLRALEADLVGVSLCIHPGKACYIPLQHKPRESNGGFFDQAPSSVIQQISLDDALACLKPMLENPSIKKIGQNLKYDMLVLGRYGIQLQSIEDTMVMSYNAHGTQHGHGMDELAKRYLNHETIKYTDIVGKGKDQVTFDYVDLDIAKDYAAEDADITMRLYLKLRQNLVDAKTISVYETLDKPLISVLLAMEQTGIKVDVNALNTLGNGFAIRINELETEIHQLAGRPFTIGSPKQLGEILFDEMSLEGGKKGKSGSYGTGHDILEGLAAQGHTLPERVLEWRSLSKLKSTYTDLLAKDINAQTGRIHTSFGMTITSTGRLSSSDPNLQNIPIRTEEGRKIRQAFVPKPGHKLVSLDYSQIELRLLAHAAKIDSLRDAFLQGKDIHTKTASEVFGVPLEQVDAMLRRNAKAINFGIIYGISAFGLARQLKIPQSDAARYIKSYKEKYPGIVEYMEETKEIARKQGYVETLFGRKCFIKGINDKNGAVRGFAERQAINAPLQGTAADIIKKAMNQIHAVFEKSHHQSKLLLQVHDELIFEVPEQEIETVPTMTKLLMEKAAHLDVPLEVDVGIGENWDEAH